MKRILTGAACAALLTVVLAAPAVASTPYQGMPPNDVLMSRNLRRLGLLPRYANGQMAAGLVRAVYGAGPRYKVSMPGAAQSVAGSQTPLGRALRVRAASAGAATTYVSKPLVLLVEFGDSPWPAAGYDGQPVSESGHPTAGPLHGQIPAPAAGDNSTFWPGDFSTTHYRQELFGSSYPLYDATSALRGTSSDTMKNYYLEMSKGAYTVNGDVVGWVKLEYPESWYGADSDPALNGIDDLTGPVWRVARDAVATFAAENPTFDWSLYDRENPYGIVPGGFNQPDGYVDHLILVHAGADESAGGGAQGNDAIWAHSSNIQESASGGPGGGPGMMVPGTAGKGPQGKGIWVSNYTINPEDGDIGVFCHEFAHDLGLPDEYDYTPSSPTGDATSGFWTLMSSGSWLGKEWGLGSKPAPMNVWDKTALGFIAPKEVKSGTTATVTLQPAATGNATDSGVRISLPKARHTVTLSGDKKTSQWYAGMGNGLDRTLTSTKALAVPRHGKLTMRTWYDIEPGYDWGFVYVSSDGGKHWKTVRSPGHTMTASPGVYGLTGADVTDWRRPISYDLSAYGGKKVLVRFRYTTDGSTYYRGWELAGVKIGAHSLQATDYVSRGWMRARGVVAQMTERYYMAEYRTYDGFDASLRYGYQLDPGATGANVVDWFAYDPGLVLIYRDTFYSDNDVASHYGVGGWMVVDGRPQPDSVTYDTSTVGYWRPRIQVRDAALGLDTSADQSIYFQDKERGVDVGQATAPGKPAQPLFNDAGHYWFAQAPEAGTKVPHLGVRIEVKSMTPAAMTILVTDK